MMHGKNQAVWMRITIFVQKWYLGKNREIAVGVKFRELPLEL
jgi:hypothetical protein